MDQPLFACKKCYRNFPQSEMSHSGQTCKGCNPHHSTFKQCEFCKSDFKYYVYGAICPKCQSLKTKYGEPQSCSICQLKTAFGAALVCQRCLHYRNRFGEPRQCQSCGNTCAFLKDEESREKVDGQILCWVCTYNFKLSRSRERFNHSSTKRRHDITQSVDGDHLKTNNDVSKRTRAEDYRLHKSGSNQANAQQINLTNQTHNLDSVYNEHLLTIGQLQDEVKNLNRKLVQKDNELLSKDRTIAELRSEMIEMKSVNEDRTLKLKSASKLEQDRLTSTIRQLQKEKASLMQSSKKRRQSNAGGSLLRHSASSISLFNPDSSIVLNSAEKRSKKSTNKPSFGDQDAAFSGLQPIDDQKFSLVDSEPNTDSPLSIAHEFKHCDQSSVSPQLTTSDVNDEANDDLNSKQEDPLGFETLSDSEDDVERCEEGARQGDFRIDV